MNRLPSGLAVVLAASVVSPGCARQVALEPGVAGPRSDAAWIFDGSGSWRIEGERLVLATPGVPGGSIRRPAALAVIRGDPLRGASVRLQLRSTAPVDAPQRDLAIVLGYQTPSRFYYVHLAGLTDEVHNGIFLVADADRRRLDAGTGGPQLTDQSWHDVRVEWDGASGRMDVFFDGSAEPVLSAIDRTLTEGRVGVGSFDDTGEFRSIRVLNPR